VQTLARILSGIPTQNGIAGIFASGGKRVKGVKAFVGMPVILNGKRIGHVACLTLDEGLKCVTGLRIARGLRGNRYIPSSAVSLFGDVAVLVTEEGVRPGGERGLNLRRATTTDGQILGAITGALIDERTLSVAALELSSGWWEDLARGRRYVYGWTACQGENVILECDGERGSEHEEQRNLHGDHHGRADRRGGGDGVGSDGYAGTAPDEANGD
jgi:uncharacterized protein YrrD